MYCCGYERLTPFCSQCGKTTDINSIEGLLYHVEKYYKSAKADYDTRCEIHGKDKSYNKNIKKRVDKWDCWRKALKKLIQESKNGKDLNRL